MTIQQTSQSLKLEKVATIGYEPPALDSGQGDALSFAVPVEGTDLVWLNYQPQLPGGMFFTPATVSEAGSVGFTLLNFSGCHQELPAMVLTLSVIRAS